MKYTLKYILKEIVQKYLSEQPEELTPIEPGPGQGEEGPRGEEILPAPAPDLPSGEISLEQAKQLIVNTSKANGGKGGFFTVTFVKKDGTIRTLNGRLDVKKYLRGGSLGYDPSAFNLIPVFDVQIKGYRMINANTIISLKIGGKSYTTPETPENAPELTPSTDQNNIPNNNEPVNEINRMRKLAGLLKEGGKEKIKVNGKEVDVDSIEIDGIEAYDYPEFTDAFITNAEFIDGTTLDEYEIEELSDKHDYLISKLIHDRQLYLD